MASGEGAGESWMPIAVAMAPRPRWSPSQEGEGREGAEHSATVWGEAAGPPAHLRPGLTHGNGAVNVEVAWSLENAGGSPRWKDCHPAALQEALQHRGSARIPQNRRATGPGGAVCLGKQAAGPSRACAGRGPALHTARRAGEGPPRERRASIGPQPTPPLLPADRMVQGAQPSTRAPWAPDPDAWSGFRPPTGCPWTSCGISEKAGTPLRRAGLLWEGGGVPTALGTGLRRAGPSSPGDPPLHPASGKARALWENRSCRSPGGGGAHSSSAPPPPPSPSILCMLGGNFGHRRRSENTWLWPPAHCTYWPDPHLPGLGPRPMCSAPGCPRNCWRAGPCVPRGSGLAPAGHRCTYLDRRPQAFTATRSRALQPLSPALAWPWGGTPRSRHVRQGLSPLWTPASLTATSGSSQVWPCGTLAGTGPPEPFLGTTLSPGEAALALRRGDPPGRSGVRQADRFLRGFLRPPRPVPGGAEARDPGQPTWAPRGPWKADRRLPGPLHWHHFPIQRHGVSAEVVGRPGVHAQEHTCEHTQAHTHPQAHARRGSSSNVGAACGQEAQQTTLSSLLGGSPSPGGACKATSACLSSQLHTCPQPPTCAPRTGHLPGLPWPCPRPARDSPAGCSWHGVIHLKSHQLAPLRAPERAGGVRKATGRPRGDTYDDHLADVPAAELRVG